MCPVEGTKVTYQRRTRYKQHRANYTLAMATGRVIGGDFRGAIVSPRSRGTLFIQVAFKRRKLDADNIASWRERPARLGGSTASAVGRAVTGAVLPRVISRSASAAVGAAIETTARPSHTVEVTWADGKQSLIKLPDSMFTHFSFLLQSLQEQEDELKSAEHEVDTAIVSNPAISEQAFSLVSGIIKDRFSSKQDVRESVDEQVSDTPPNIAEQLLLLADLRDKGILTEEEFATKKTALIEKL